MKKIKKLEDEYSKLKVRCKCGHIILMPVYIDKLICNWCGRLVQNSTLTYFKYKIKKESDNKWE